MSNAIQPINRLALIGVGMIGGSLIWSMKRAGLVNHVVGVDINLGELKTATELGIIDSKAYLDSLHDIDAIVLATPVGAMQGIFAALKDKPFIDTAIITDVGSTKQSVIDAAQKGLGYLPENFVPSHPIAGREHSGVQYAEEMMFYGYRVLVTPHDNSDYQATQTVKSWWRACGAVVECLTPLEHDHILAATSHLPHILAYGLMENLSKNTDSPIFNYAAGGFKSFTRTASSNPIMWRDVCLNNKDDILFWLDRYQQTLSDMRQMIADGDGEALVDIFERSKTERDKHLLTPIQR